MRITRILSANIFVSSWGQVSDFYLEDLALPLGSTRPPTTSIYAGETCVSFIAAAEEDRSLIGGNTGLNIRTRGEGDLQRLIGRLRERGHSVPSPEPHRSGHAVMLKDPCGNRFALWEDFDSTDCPHMFDGPASVAVRVRDIRRAMMFYHGILELPMFDQPSANTALFFPDATNLIVTTDAQWSACPPVSGATGLVLFCEEPGALMGKLQHQQVRFADAPQSTDEVMAATILDPDGNQLTILGPNH